MRLSAVFFLVFAGLLVFQPAFSQSVIETPENRADTIVPDPIRFTPVSASGYIIDLLKRENLWRPANNLLKPSLERLVGHYQQPYDSVVPRLLGFNYDGVELKLTSVRRNDTLPVRWLNSSTFIVDTIRLEREPVIYRKTLVINAIDSSVLFMRNGSPELRRFIDSLLLSRETISEVFIDTIYLRSKRVTMHRVENDMISPPLMLRGSGTTARFLPDSSALVVSRYKRYLVANQESPFYIVPGERMTDSLQHAVRTLVMNNDARDSLLVFFRSGEGTRTPYWLSNRDTEYYRFWVKNSSNDSLTIWIGNPNRREINLLLEDNINVERRERRRVDDVPISTLRAQRSLAAVRPLEEIPVYWRYDMSSAFTLNQTYFSNWARGGENSLSTMLELRGSAQYTNKAFKSQWANTGRLRYGSIVTEAHGFRTNTDLLETNSQYNRTINSKIDFSSTLYFKTQVAKGYNYPNDSVVVSKFLNPGTFTVGVGFEIKPFKKTRINFAPLSYRNTFVLDTARINQKIHGIDKDKKSRQEMGGQLVFVNSVSPLKGLTLNNNVRLFSGYLNKPENVDVDWELNIEQQINWFFLVRLNFHVIYDDDIKITILGNDGKPIIRPDGTRKTGPRTQLKQFLGLTLSFRL